MTAIAKLKAELAGLRLEENIAIVKQKSRDFFWYSPVLKSQLDHITADLVVYATSEADMSRVLTACYAYDVPLTVRGAGTGNYGQAMPLAGGLVLDVSAINDIRLIAPGRVITGPGAILGDIDAAARAHSNQELRLHPSTARTATIAGFIAGGSGGVGSIHWGGLRDLGNIIRLRVLTMEATPRSLDIRGADLHKVSHAYGTNGIITEVEMPLAPAYEWIETLVSFDDVMSAARCANELGVMDGLLKKELAVVGAPVPFDYFLRHQKFLTRNDSVIIAMIAPHAIDAFQWAVEQYKGRITFRSDAASAADSKGLPPVYELTWNHTTLRALRVDPTITYLQVLYPAPGHLALVERMHHLLGDEVPVHLEFTRFNGTVTAFGLPLLRFTSVERLDEIVRLFEDNGCPVFNPHRYTLEEGGMKQSNPVQLAFKREADPKGLLNPGKMIAWDDPHHDFSADKLYLFPGMQDSVG
ncbi:MAG: FAD-binding oxidoreductase [Hyphomicrobiales bacterium]|nr:FAD-binding oxidoreductase [Hyphomicrobiales bacterium]